MRAAGDSETGSTLFAVIRDMEDPEAWNRFVARYEPKIRTWCRKWLGEHDADDATQIVFLKLSQSLKTFSYDAKKSFRGWLRTVTRFTSIDLWNENQRAGKPIEDSKLQAVVDKESASNDWDALMDRLIERELLEQGIAQAQLRVSRTSGEAFRLLALEEIQGAEVAKQLGISVAAVFQAKYRVQQILKEELGKLD